MKRIFTCTSYVYFISMISVMLIITESSFSQTDPLMVSGKAKQKKDNYTGAIADYTGAINKNEQQVQQYFKKYEGSNAINALDSSFAIPYYLRGFFLPPTEKITNLITILTQLSRKTRSSQEPIMNVEG